MTKTKIIPKKPDNFQALKEATERLIADERAQMFGQEAANNYS